MELYLSEHGTKLSRKRTNFIVTTSEKEHVFNAEKITAIILEGECSLTSGAIKLAVDQDIPIVITDNYGSLLGEFYRSAGTKNGKLKKNQYIFFNSDEAFEISKGWIIEKLLKLKFQLETILKRRKKALAPIFQIKRYIEKIENTKGNSKENKALIMGYEGSATRIYFSTLSEILGKKWKFSKREHQKAKEPYNIVLNYMLGILYRRIEKLLLKEGFDSSVGIIHTEGNKRLPLLYDFIEKYRFLALEETYNLFNQKLITDDCFTKKEDRLFLSNTGKYTISSHINSVLKTKKKYEKKSYTIAEIINLEIKKFKELILNIDADKDD